jgi:archaellum component FlaG (FlaF/FlaG flagellin family)
MAKNTAAIPAKTTGNTYAAAEFEVLRGFVDAPSQALSTFTGSLITLDGTGSYDAYTLAANLSITFAESGHEEGNSKWVKIISDGTDTVTLIKPSAYTLLIPSSFTNGGTLAAGTYTMAFAFIDGEIQMKYEAVSAVVNWTSFNGSTTHLYFGDILKSVITGADKKWALEVRLRNWDNSTGIQRILSFWANATIDAGPAITLNQTSAQVKLNFRDRINALNQSNVETITTMPSSDTLLRIEYDGSIDTSSANRVIVYFGGVSQADGFTDFGTWPFDIDSDITAWEFSFGRGRKPDGTFFSGGEYNGDAFNLKVQSWNGSSWDDEVNVPDLSTGIDISGNGNDGTFVA